MKNDRATAVRVILVMLAVMWVAEVVDVVSGNELDELGIEPRDPEGLVGVGTAPFLHAGFGHLLANTLPFVILGLVVAFEGLRRLLAVTAIVMVVGGLGTWLFAASNSIHIGASGVVFGYAAYLIVRGVFNRNLGELAVAVVVVLFLGGALLGGLVPRAGVSWQGHFFGAVGGMLAAWMLSKRPSAAPAEPLPSGKAW
jgi:membrane associated rhomboid family serine protease